MQRLQAYKYELMPTGQQQRDMRRFAGSCRFVFNKALALQKARYERGEKKLGYAGLCKLLTEWHHSAENAVFSQLPIRQFTFIDGTEQRRFLSQLPIRQFTRPPRCQVLATSAFSQQYLQFTLFSLLSISH